MEAFPAVVGVVIQTLGFSAANDGGGATYIVESGDSSDGFSRILLDNGNTAVIKITNYIHSDMLGGTPATLYVTPSGSNSNTGFKSASPLLTIQAAIDVLESFQSSLGGEWQISLAAGSYGKGRFPASGLRSEKEILIFGPDVGGHPNIPTAIITEGASAAAQGIRLDTYTQVKVKDVLFTGFDGSTSSAGFTGTRWSRLITENAHFTDCYFGASALSSCYLDIKGGIFTRCGTLNGVASSGAGFRSLFNTNHAVGLQNAGDLTNGPIFRDCETGGFAQESSVGHADYCTFEDCNYGVITRVNSRFNVDGSDFKRNGTATRGDGNSHIYISDNTTFGTGADKNRRASVATSGSERTTSRLIQGVQLAYAINERSYLIDYIDQTIDTTGEQIFHTSVLKAPFWEDDSASITQCKKLTFKIMGELTGTAGNKTIVVRLGVFNTATSFFTYSDTGTFTVYGCAYFHTDSRQFLFSEAFCHLSQNQRLSSRNGSEDMSTDTNFALSAELESASDSVTISLIELGMAG